MRVFFIFTDCSDDALSYPLGIGSLSSVLKKKHIVKGVYIKNKYDKEDLIRQISDFKPGLICYSATSPAFSDIKKIARYIKKKMPDTITICGGIQATLYQIETISAEGIDYIGVGESEKSLLEFIDNIEQNKTPVCPPGIWKLENNHLVKNKLYPLQDLNRLPPIDYEVFGIDFIKKLVKENNGWLRYISSRGCPYKCSYCHNNMIRDTYAREIGCPISKLNYLRFRDIDLCISDIQQIVTKYNVKVINLMDDLFCLDKQRTIEFCELFESKLPEDVGFSVQTHLNFLDEDVIRALKSGRCLRVVVGVESASKRILSLFKRHTNITLMGKALSLLIKARFKYGVWTLNMLGNPTETYAEMLETISFNASNVVDVFKVNFLSPYPDSNIYNFCQEHDLLVDDLKQQKFNTRYVSALKHGEKENAFLEKFFDIGHWYLNVNAPLGIREHYLSLIDEVEKIKFGHWEAVKDHYMLKDEIISESLSDQGKPFYCFKYKGQITGRVIGLKK